MRLSRRALARPFRWSVDNGPTRGRGGLCLPRGRGGFLTLPPTGFDWRLSSVANTRPATAIGTSVTPGTNAKGAWAQLLAGTAVIHDVYGVLINANSFSVSAAVRDALVDIGYDPAGGATYTVLVPDLFVSCAAPVANVDTGIWYYFPLFIPAGSSLAARAAVNNATVGTGRVYVKLLGEPRHPELVKAGRKVVAYGIVAAASCGTAVTPGTTADGAWVSVGPTSDDHWWFQLGFGITDSTMSALAYFNDLATGDPTTKVLLIEDSSWGSDSNERIGNIPDFACASRPVPAGSGLFVRSQCSGTLDAAYTMTAYGLG